jgi:hypothetical protein
MMKETSGRAVATSNRERAKSARANLFSTFAKRKTQDLQRDNNKGEGGLY